MNNSAKVSGGAIYISGCGISLFECSFSNNSAGVGSGNDIYQQSLDETNNTLFLENIKLSNTNDTITVDNALMKNKTLNVIQK